MGRMLSKIESIVVIKMAKSIHAWWAMSKGGGIKQRSVAKRSKPRTLKIRGREKVMHHSFFLIIALVGLVCRAIILKGRQLFTDFLSNNV